MKILRKWHKFGTGFEIMKEEDGNLIPLTPEEKVIFDEACNYEARYGIANRDLTILRRELYDVLVELGLISNESPPVEECLPLELWEMIKYHLTNRKEVK